MSRCFNVLTVTGLQLEAIQEIGMMMFILQPLLGSNCEYARDFAEMFKCAAALFLLISYENRPLLRENPIGQLRITIEAVAED